MQQLVQVACDADDDPSLGFNPSCNNSFAIQVFSNFERALSVYRYVIVFLENLNDAPGAMSRH